MNTTKPARYTIRTVKFTYGTCRDAILKVPVGAFSLFDIACLIQESYLEHMFRPGCGLMSDECLLHCIGRSNFFAGALGGYKTRLKDDDYARVVDMVESDIMLASKIVKFREPNLSSVEVYRKASMNEGLSATDRAAFLEMIKISG